MVDVAVAAISVVDGAVANIPMVYGAVAANIPLVYGAVAAIPVVDGAVPLFLLLI